MTLKQVTKSNVTTMRLSNSTQEINWFVEGVHTVSKVLDQSVKNLRKSDKTAFEREVLSRAVMAVGLTGISLSAAAYHAVSFCVKLPIQTAILLAGISCSELLDYLDVRSLAQHLSSFIGAPGALIAVPLVMIIHPNRIEGEVGRFAHLLFTELENKKSWLDTSFNFSVSVPGKTYTISGLWIELSVGLQLLGLAGAVAMLKVLPRPQCLEMPQDLAES